MPHRSDSRFLFLLNISTQSAENLFPSKAFTTPPLTLALGSEYIATFWGFWGMTRTSRRVGIVLFQLGGPDTLEAIEPFLYNLFCDPDIIDFPFARIGRNPLAKPLPPTRPRKVQHHSPPTGGGSPIRRHTERQARA